MADEVKDDWLSDPEDDQAPELDQADIDALLSGAPEPAPAAAEELVASDVPELDQADIDALLSGGGGGGQTVGQTVVVPQAVAAEPAAADLPELDQSDIDALLSGATVTAPASGGGQQVATEFEDPDQAEIDKLFADVEDEPKKGAEPGGEVDFKDVIDGGGGATGDAFGFDTEMSDFNAEEFALDEDIPEIPETSHAAVAPEPTLGAAAPSRDSGLSDAETQFFSQEGTASGPAPAGSKPKFQMPDLPAFLHGKKVLTAIAGGCLLLIGTTVFLLTGKKDAAVPVAHQPEAVKPAVAEHAPVKHEAPPAEEPSKPEEPPNAVPVAASPTYVLGEGAKELAVVLPAFDKDGDPLEYVVVTQPKHGVLDGAGQFLTYRPGPEFKGEDVFTFRANDGKSISETAEVRIRDAKAAVAQVQAPGEGDKPAEPKSLQSKQLAITARDQSYALNSTDRLTIDWKTIWLEANELPYPDDVQVEIVGNVEHGKLAKMSASQHRYQPDPYFSGMDQIRYRFRLGKKHLSKTKTVELKVALGQPAPQIRVSGVRETYRPGETAVIDAAGSRDDHRKSLVFAWEQVAGVPVQLQMLNDEGSRVGFIVPEDFSNVVSPGVLFRLTATDRTGKKDSQEIRVKTASGRRPALRGLDVAGPVALRL